MAKFLDKFKRKKDGTEETIQKIEKINKKKQKKDNLYGEFYDPFDDKNLNELGGYDEYPLTAQAQKPESFHRYILENQYQDLERSIRGIKDIWDKKQQKFISVRKKVHCFTEEEAENILRTAQSHLSADIKLSYIPRDVFGAYMIGLFDQFYFLFRSIAEYNYGRYGNYKSQYTMKVQNLKILIELWTRIQANYSRAIAGQENRFTHENIKGQESLNTSGSNILNRGYF
jgi:hypothetical protein